MHTSGPVQLDPITVTPPLSAHLVSYNSAAYQSACQIQALRYTRACAPKEGDTFQHYLETVTSAPKLVLPLVVSRHDVISQDSIVGTARLELPSATTIEAIMHFLPDSLSASVLTQSTFAEIGAFATHPDLAWPQVLDVLDSIAAAIVQLATMYHIDHLWVFPRYSMMSLVLAEIPDLLPPYRFALNTDVAGWNEESASLQKIRKLRMKDLFVDPQVLPTLYEISPAQLAEDLARRVHLREQRQQTDNLPFLLRAAMRHAHQQMVAQTAIHQGNWKGANKDATTQEIGATPLSRAG